jgi:hypothetical protein
VTRQSPPERKQQQRGRTGGDSARGKKKKRTSPLTKGAAGARPDRRKSRGSSGLVKVLLHSEEEDSGKE